MLFKDTILKLKLMFVSISENSLYKTYGKNVISLYENKSKLYYTSVFGNLSRVLDFLLSYFIRSITIIFQELSSYIFLYSTAYSCQPCSLKITFSDNMSVTGDVTDNILIK